MYTWILVFLLCSWKIEKLFLKWKDQKLQTMQLKFDRQHDHFLIKVDLLPWGAPSEKSWVQGLIFTFHFDLHVHFIPSNMIYMNTFRKSPFLAPVPIKEVSVSVCN